jgi:hypothetical protein
MKFKNYCIVVMGDTLGVQAEIQKISETAPNVLDAKGILIATFSSLAEPNELTEWFKENKRSFLVFELDQKTSGFNITKKQIHEGLFGWLDKIDTNVMSDEFFKTMSESVIKSKLKPLRKELKTNKLNEKLISNMSPKERHEKLNELIDNGLENLSEEDKKLLPLLAK